MRSELEILKELAETVKNCTVCRIALSQCEFCRHKHKMIQLVKEYEKLQQQNTSP